MPNITRLSNVSNVSPGGSGLVEVPVGPFTYHRIGCKFTGVLVSEIRNIQVKLNNAVIVHWRTLQHLLDYNEHIGAPDPAPGNFMMHFAAPRQLFPLPSDQVFTAMGTAGLDTFQITYDVDIAATTPNLVWYAERDSSERSPGFVHYIQPYNYNVSTGKTSLDTFPKSNNKDAFPSIAMLAMLPSNGKKITEAYFLGNNHEYVEQNTIEFQNETQKIAGRIIVGDWHYMDFVTANKPLTAMPTLTFNDMRVVVSVSEAVDVQFYYHAYGVMGAM